ncbi:MAG: PilZ domain-containing protein [bacterium]
MKTRQYLRVPLPIILRIKVHETDDDFRDVSVEDVSWGGVFLVMNPPPPVGSRVLMQFSRTEENVSLELWGTVVRRREKKGKWPTGVGVEFDTLDEESRSLIQNLVVEEILALIKNSL